MANVKISGLPSASSVAATNEFEINEVGTSKKVTASQISTYTKSTLDGDKGDITVSSSGSVWTIDNGAVNLTSKVTGTLPVANGGTGATTLTANNVLLGNGTSAPLTVAPGTSGNVLTSNGTAWTSAAAPSPTIASTAEAQTGTNNTNFITPLRMREGFNASGSAPVYACRAWVNFNGTGTVEIRASGNVSSITDNGAGNYTVNFTTAFQDTDYAIMGFARWNQTTAYAGLVSTTSNGTKTVSAFQIYMTQSNSPISGVDSSEFNVAAFR